MADRSVQPSLRPAIARRTRLEQGVVSAAGRADSLRGGSR